MGFLDACQPTSISKQQHSSFLQLPPTSGQGQERREPVWACDALGMPMGIAM